MPFDNTTLTMYNLKSAIDQFILKNPGKSFECKSKYSLEDFTFAYEAPKDDDDDSNDEYFDENVDKEDIDALLAPLHKELERREKALHSTNDSPLGPEAIESVQSAIEKKFSDYLHQRDKKLQESIDNAKSQRNAEILERNVKILERKAEILEQYEREQELKALRPDNQSLLCVEESEPSMFLKYGFELLMRGVEPTEALLSQVQLDPLSYQKQRNMINQDNPSGVNLSSISLLSPLFDYSKFLPELSSKFSMMQSDLLLQSEISHGTNLRYVLDSYILEHGLSKLDDLAESTGGNLDILDWAIEWVSSFSIEDGNSEGSIRSSVLRALESVPTPSLLVSQLSEVILTLPKPIQQASEIVFNTMSQASTNVANINLVKNLKTNAANFVRTQGRADILTLQSSPTCWNNTSPNSSFMIAFDLNDGAIIQRIDISHASLYKGDGSPFTASMIPTSMKVWGILSASAQFNVTGMNENDIVSSFESQRVPLGKYDISQDESQMHQHFDIKETEKINVLALELFNERNAHSSNMICIGGLNIFGTPSNLFV
mmetsp:Transcript_23949/g.29414  ORF Transcript_23949/g.29414 Transcript_23949/m.29414 type:complete len:546 (-) Transcript_23949:7-1644(-)